MFEAAGMVDDTILDWYEMCGQCGYDDSLFQCFSEGFEMKVDEKGWKSWNDD